MVKKWRFSETSRAIFVQPEWNLNFSFLSKNNIHIYKTTQFSSHVAISFKIHPPMFTYIESLQKITTIRTKSIGRKFFGSTQNSNTSHLNKFVLILKLCSSSIVRLHHSNIHIIFIFIHFSIDSSGSLTHSFFIAIEIFPSWCV